MADPSSHSSLLSLVNSHLSRNNLNEPSTSGSGPLRLPPFSINRASSDTTVPSISLRFPLPSTSTSEHPLNELFFRQFGHFPGPNELKLGTQGARNESMSDCPINDVLARQLSNMFKAREAKAEMQKKIEEDKARETLEASCMIDLMPAINRGYFQPPDNDNLSDSSSVESLNIPDITENSATPPELPDLAVAGPSRPISPVKPLNTDMSYILQHKIGKCSRFGKVLCARYRPVVAPYVRVKIPHKKIKPFDFSTPSPDDISRMRSKIPYYKRSNKTMSIFD